MVNEKEEAPSRQGPESAKISIGKDTKNTETIDESVVIYRSWFDCLLAQGHKNFTIAMYALLSFAFYGTDISSFHLPRRLEAILNTFCPIIVMNRSKRKGGNKGASYGRNGGRPSWKDDLTTPKGYNSGAPLGMNNNGNGNGKTNENENVNDENNEGVSTTTNKDIDKYKEVFFFRNVRHPDIEARKFVSHYSAVGWKLSGGEFIPDGEQRVALALRWEVRNQSTDRFDNEALSMWKSLYKMAHDYIRWLMLDSSVSFQRDSQMAIIYGPVDVGDWLNKDKETNPIVDKWKGKRIFKYVATK